MGDNLTNDPEFLKSFFAKLKAEKIKDKESRNTYPSFYRDGDGFYALISEKQLVSIFPSNDFTEGRGFNFRVYRSKPKIQKVCLDRRKCTFEEFQLGSQQLIYKYLTEVEDVFGLLAPAPDIKQLTEGVQGLLEEYSSPYTPEEMEMLDEAYPQEQMEYGGVEFPPEGDPFK